MVNENVMQVIGEIFPNAKPTPYNDNGVVFFLDNLTNSQIHELSEKTKNWSGCDFIFTSVSDQIKVNFWHTAQIG